MNIIHECGEFVLQISERYVPVRVHAWLGFPVPRNEFFRRNEFFAFTSNSGYTKLASSDKLFLATRGLLSKNVIPGTASKWS